MIIGIGDMYIGETAEIISIGGSDYNEVKKIKDMGIREGRLIDLLAYDDVINKKAVISIDSSRIALDIKLIAMIKVRPIKHYYEVIRSQAYTDKLTGCFNRHSSCCLIMAEYEKFVANKTPMSVAMADIDHFKKINDTYGHAAGDLVLQSIAALFKQSLRRSDLLFRWGGEEFLFLLRGTNLEEARQVCNRIRTAVLSYVFPPFESHGFVTISIGGCGLPPDRTVEHLIEMADAALYTAKKNGRNRVEVYV